MVFCSDVFAGMKPFVWGPRGEGKGERERREAVQNEGRVGEGGVEREGWCKMGRVRTRTVKKAAKVIIEKYYSRLTLDFHTNKMLCNEIAQIPSKRLRNKIAGFTTHMMKRIQRGPVRGISLKLQEEERERRLDYVPDESAINTDHIEVDRDTLEMLKANGLHIPGVSVHSGYRGGGDGPRGRVHGDRGARAPRRD